MRIMRASFLLVVVSSVACQQLPLIYTLRSVAGAGAGMCPDTQDLREHIEQDIRSLINSSVLSALGTEPGYGASGYGSNLNFYIYVAPNLSARNIKFCSMLNFLLYNT